MAFTHVAPTLLSLPTEIRRQILRYAFTANCSPSSPDKKFKSSDIQVTLAPWYHETVPRRARLDAAELGTWGKESMSRILRINHQFLSDAIEVLYSGDFVFQFPARFTANDVASWLSIIGNKKLLIKRIGVQNDVLFRYLCLPEKTNRSLNWMFLALKRELENLRTVEIRIKFLRSAILRGEEGRQRIFSNLVELVGVFRGLATIVPEKFMMFDKHLMIMAEDCVQKMEDAVA